MEGCLSGLSGSRESVLCHIPIASEPEKTALPKIFEKYFFIKLYATHHFTLVRDSKCSLGCPHDIIWGIQVPIALVCAFDLIVTR